MGLIVCLRQRAHNVCDEDKLGLELEHLQETFGSEWIPHQIGDNNLTRTVRHGASPDDQEKPKKLTTRD